MNATSCFVPENTELKNTVKIIDVVRQSLSAQPIQPAQPQSQPQSQQQRQSVRRIHSDHKDVTSLKAYINDTAKKQYSCRYISICQRNSFQPLQLTPEMLETIIDGHEISERAASSLREITSVFYTRNLKTEMVFCVPFAEFRSQHTIEVAYTIRYPEFKPSEKEWTMRQTGIYQRVNLKTKQSLCIIFNPTPESKFHQSLLRHLDTSSNEDESIEAPIFQAHQILFATYMPAWRHYIASLELRFLPIANTAAATYINEELRIGHAQLSSLISIEKDFMQVATILATAIDVLNELALLAKDSNTTNSDVQREEFTQDLKNIQRQCEVYSRTATHLQQRVQITAQLLADTLLFRDQVLAHEQNGNMLQLNRSAVFLTTLTLLYLPASFLTSFFGMNFFAMDQENNRIMGTPMIWIFVVSAIVLTLATFAMYRWLSSHDRFFRRMAPKKWTTADLKLSKLSRRWTGSKMGATADRGKSGV